MFLLSGCDTDKWLDATSCDVLPFELATPVAGGPACKTTLTDDCEVSSPISGYKTYSNYADAPVMMETSFQVKTRRDASSCIGDTDWDVTETKASGTPVWMATNVFAANSDMNTFDDCGVECTGSGCDAGCLETGACNGQYNAEFDVVPGTGCDRYADTQLDLTVGTAAASEKYAAEAECAAGTGAFQLVPIWKYDRDQDGLVTAVYLPVMTSGTGTMTPRAWVTAATLNSAPAGATVRLVDDDTSFVIGTNDHPVGGTGSGFRAVTGSHTYATGLVSGTPYVLVEEADPDDVLDGSLNLTWTCQSGGTAQTDAQGWQFRLSDIGCSGLAQKLTLRYKTGPGRVELEMYGHRGYQIVEPTTTTTSGQAFIFDRWGLELDATLLSYSANTATVRIDQLDVNGTSACSPGTYTFNAE